MASYMARLNYGFKDKYLLTASARLDGSSVLADGHKWAPFYSSALGWRIDQEEFMQNVKFVDALKLRLGAGVTGNAAIGAYGTKGGITQTYYNWGTTSSTTGYILSDLSAASPVLLANSNLGWERTTQYNLGLDYTLLKSRINGSVDVYQTKTNDLLMRMSIPSTTGYVQTWSNIGSTEGWGVDFQLNSLNIKTIDFAWSTTLTWSLDRCKVTELSNGRTQDLSSLLFVGKDLGVFYDYVYDGIWKTSEATEAAKYGRKPGQIRVKDLNNDGVIDANNDKQIVGKSRPDWSGGISNTFNYKNFELSFFIYSRWGFKVNTGGVNLGGLYQMRKLDYWIAGVNENAEYYSPGSNGVNADLYATSQGYLDGSFVKMRNISLGYNFNSKQLNKLGVSNLKIYAQVMNPFTIYSKCKILDTDLTNYDNNTTTTGTDTTIKGLVFGINVGF
jgi:TonB-linked SusC/RagA family outer membrane protein